jgi:hypothetical protein
MPTLTFGRWVVRFSLRPLNPLWKNPLFYWGANWVDPRGVWTWFKTEKKIALIGNFYKKFPEASSPHYSCERNQCEQVLIRIRYLPLPWQGATAREQTLSDSYARKNNIKFTYRLVGMYTYIPSSRARGWPCKWMSNGVWFMMPSTPEETPRHPSYIYIILK